MTAGIITILVASGLLILWSFFVAVLLTINDRYHKCPHCNKVFKPSVKSFIFDLYTPFGMYTKCPHCNKRGWCKPTVKTDSTKEEKK